ncbi:cholecystokinin receptor-like [Mytilus californianus]|uniref:cholecystokinin receptor-like n=1 Tax=Mytilus californianus TaxID=6549 RepID=UPI0022455959|nr:cholecystokinin receptor-like [Mytilus californianus]
MYNITASELNGMISKTLIPNIVILAIYVVLGTCGNVLVLLVYSFQMKEPSDERYFIPILAAFDLLTTVYCGIYMIIQCLNQVTFTHSILCKTTQFFIGLTTFIPILLLLIIAVQRYLKVCLPLKPAMSLHVKKTALILTIVISLLCALPLVFVYGSVPFHSFTYGITGTRCGKLKEGHQLARAVYAIVIGFFAVAIVTTLIVLYSLIGCTVFRQLKMNKCKSSRVEFRNSVTKTDEEGASGTENSGVTQNTITSDLDSKLSNSSKEQRLENNHQTALSQLVGSKRRQTDNRRITHKLTAMFFVITVVFILSYFPKVMLLLVEGLNKDFWEKVSNTERPGLMFIYQMFIINNIVNPFIYAFMDIKFRKEATIFLNRVFQCRF